MHVCGRWEEAPHRKALGPRIEPSCCETARGVHNLTCAKRENTEKETKAIIHYVQFDCVYPRKKNFGVLAVCTIQLYTVLFCGFQKQKQSYFSARRQLIGSQNGLMHCPNCSNNVWRIWQLLNAEFNNFFLSESTEHLGHSKYLGIKKSCQPVALSHKWTCQLKNRLSKARQGTPQSG